MGANDGHHGVGKLHPFENLGSNDRMNFHLLEFFRSQPPRLGDDVLRHRQFSDIVQHCGGAKRGLFRFVQPQLARNLHRIDLHALKMVVRGLILRVDCQRQRFNRTQVEARNLLRVALLIVQAFEIQAIGPID